MTEIKHIETQIGMLVMEELHKHDIINESTIVLERKLHSVHAGEVLMENNPVTLNTKELAVAPERTPFMYTIKLANGHHIPITWEEFKRVYMDYYSYSTIESVMNTFGVTKQNMHSEEAYEGAVGRMVKHWVKMGNLEAIKIVQSMGLSQMPSPKQRKIFQDFEREQQDGDDHGLDMPQASISGVNRGKNGRFTAATRDVNRLNKMDVISGEFYNDVSRIPKSKYNGWVRIWDRVVKTIKAANVFKYAKRTWGKTFIMGYATSNNTLIEVWYNSIDSTFSIHDRNGANLTRNASTLQEAVRGFTKLIAQKGDAEDDLNIFKANNNPTAQSYIRGINDTFKKNTIEAQRQDDLIAAEKAKDSKRSKLNIHLAAGNRQKKRDNDMPEKYRAKVVQRAENITELRKKREKEEARKASEEHHAQFLKDRAKKERKADVKGDSAFGRARSNISQAYRDGVAANKDKRKQEYEANVRDQQQREAELAAAVAQQKAAQDRIDKQREEQEKADKERIKAAQLEKERQWKADHAARFSDIRASVKKQEVERQAETERQAAEQKEFDDKVAATLKRQEQRKNDDVETEEGAKKRKEAIAELAAREKAKQKEQEDYQAKLVAKVQATKEARKKEREEETKPNDEARLRDMEKQVKNKINRDARELANGREERLAAIAAANKKTSSSKPKSHNEKVADLERRLDNIITAANNMDVSTDPNEEITYHMARKQNVRDRFIQLSNELGELKAAEESLRNTSSLDASMLEKARKMQLSKSKSNKNTTSFQARSLDIDSLDDELNATNDAKTRERNEIEANKTAKLAGSSSKPKKSKKPKGNKTKGKRAINETLDLDDLGYTFMEEIELADYADDNVGLDDFKQITDRISSREADNEAERIRKQAATSGFTTAVLRSTIMTDMIKTYNETRSNPRSYTGQFAGMLLGKGRVGLIRRLLRKAFYGRGQDIVTPQDTPNIWDRAWQVVRGTVYRADFVIGFSLRDEVNFEVWYVTEPDPNDVTKMISSYYVYDVTAKQSIRRNLPYYRNAITIIMAKIGVE